MIKLINFTDLNCKQKDMVLSWRNHDKIRKWMYQTSKITKEMHYSFIDGLKEKTDRIYFLVMDDSNNIGVVDLTNIDNVTKTAELGIYTNPELRAQGDILLKVIIDYAFEKLKLKKLNANVYLDNLPAIALYQRFSFQKIQEDNNLLKMTFKI